MLYVAVIIDGDDVRLIVVRASRDERTRELARYAAENASLQLSAEDEARLRALLRDGRERQAVDLYFERGGRWASERLVERTVRLPEADPGQRATVDGGASPDGMQPRYDAEIG